MSRTRIFLVLPFLALLLGAAVLADPAPVPVPDGMAKAKVLEAIRQALDNRGWIAGTEATDSIEAELHVRTHMIRVRLDYSGKDVVISYVDSENMAYREKSGVHFIHGNYNKWTRTLSIDVRKYLVLLADQDS